MVVMAIATAFTEADLKGAADARSFERGLGYVDEVEDLDVSDSEIVASVYGTSRYRVSLTVREEGLSGDCTCPYGREGFFCKHCVAVGLYVLKLGEDLPQRMEAARAERQTLTSWLESLSKEELLAELSALLDQDPDLRRSFELRAASVNLDAATVRRAVRELIMLPRHGYVDYSEAGDYASDVYKAAAAINDLIAAGGAADAIGIVREAIDLFCEAFESADDSAGLIGDAGYALVAAHLTACQAAPPDPVSLGEYLADQLLYNDYDLGLNLADYDELLGDEGLATVDDRIAAVYAENPGNWRAKGLMETITKEKGDVDGLIAIIATQLDNRGGTHLRIARELDEAGRDAEALDWAERGLREAEHPDERLIDYLASRYAAAGRNEDALNLRRDRFRVERTLANYQALRRAATESGVWPAERDQALVLLRKDASHLRMAVPWAWSGPVLVDALLDDGDLDAALTAAKNAPATTEAQWLRLADALADTRPVDALPVYLRTVESLKQHTGNDNYQRIATLLLAARACHQALGTTAEFRRYVALLRMEQKRKRNLIKILDQNGL
jgi:uncharacterized Zn finger protein